MNAVLTYILGFPLMLPAALYVTWFSGRLALGHWPRPSLDDPKDIGGITGVLYIIAGIVQMIGFPVFLTLTGFVLWFGLFRQQGRRTYIIYACAAAALMILAVLFIRSDPNRVGEWYMD